MTVATTIGLDAREFALGSILARGATETSDGANTRFELAQVVPVDGGFMPYIWATRCSDLDAFERGVESDRRVARLARLDADSSRTLYRIEWSANDETDSDGSSFDPFTRALCDFSILVEQATCVAGRWQFQLRADCSESLSGFYRACLDAGVRPEIHRIRHDPPAGATIDDASRYGLTTKQADALSLAFEAGYFSIPRGASQGELADRAGISRQAFARRLQRALDSLVANTFMVEPPSQPKPMRN